MDQTIDTLTITRRGLMELKRLYAHAVLSGDEQFIFEGREVLTAYAKYVIEYWEAK